MLVIRNNTEEKDILLSYIDTLESFKNRIAMEYDSIPKYIYIIDSDNLFNKEKLEIIDMLDIIKNKNYQEIKKNIEFFDLDIFDDIILVKTLFMSEQNTSIDMETISLLVQTEFERININYNSTDVDNNKIKSRKKILEKELSNNRSIVQKQKSTLKKYEAAINENFTSEFTYEKYSLKLSKKTDKSLLFIFDDINTNKFVPYACVNNIIKSYKSYDYPDDFGYFTADDNNFIHLKMFKHKLSKQNIDDNDFMDIFIMITENENTIEIETEINTSENLINKEEYLERLFSIFTDNEFKNGFQEQIYNISGTVFFANQNINNYLFTHIVMNDIIISPIMNTNETLKTSKDKNWLYFYFNTLITGEMAFSITNKKRFPKDLHSSIVDMETLPINSEYIRIRAKNIESEEATKRFCEIFSKILQYYSAEKEQILSFYETYIPEFKYEFTEVLENYIIEEKDLNKFIGPGYSRSCQKDRQPEFVKNNNDEIVIPPNKPKGKEGDNWIIFPKDENQEQVYLTCDYNQNGYNYPGINKNKNPCCFTTNQEQKTDYINYYKNTQIKKEYKEEVQQGMIKSNKMTKNETSGCLPDNINNIFSYILNDSNKEVIRKGVNRSKSSFLECIVYIDSVIKNNYSKISVDDIVQKRKILAKKYKDTISLCKQEMYDYTSNDILEILSDEEKYLDPLNFIRLLEIEYDCNILIFKRTEDRSGLVLPNHTQNYLRFKNSKPIFMIYEHMGSESDKAQYPQCEIIAINDNISNETEQLKYSISPETIIYENILLLYIMSNESYALSKKNNLIDFPIQKTSNIKVLQQVIDSNGKCRRIDINYADENITLFTTPIPPLNLKEIKNKEIYKTISSTVFKLTADLNSKIISQNVIEDKLKQLHIKIGDVDVYIPIKDSDILQNIEKTKEINFIDSKISQLDIYNKNRKIALYLVEYFVWRFSNFMKNKNITIPNSSLILEFIKNNVQLNSNHDYKNIKNSFKDNNSLLIGNKIAVPDEETLKRLVYSLKLKIERFHNKILNYYKKDSIDNYYSNISDFKQNPNQSLFFGEESYKNWLEQQKKTYLFSDHIELNENDTYFFQNKNIQDNKIFLAKNVDSLNSAFIIGKNWVDNGYLKEFGESFVDIPRFKLYSYKNKNNISKYIIMGKENNHDLKIIGYKVQNENKFTILLDI